jgi:hypothetical protein
MSFLDRACGGCEPLTVARSNVFTCSAMRARGSCAREGITNKQNAAALVMAAVRMLLRVSLGALIPVLGGFGGITAAWSCGMSILLE